MEKERERGGGDALNTFARRGRVSIGVEAVLRELLTTYPRGVKSALKPQARRQLKRSYREIETVLKLRETQRETKKERERESLTMRYKDREVEYKSRRMVSKKV